MALARSRRLSLDPSLLSTFDYRRASNPPSSSPRTGILAYFHQSYPGRYVRQKKHYVAYVLVYLDQGPPLLFVGRDGVSGKAIVNEVAMDHSRVQSYRIILASSRALLNIHSQAPLAPEVEGALDAVAAGDEAIRHTAPDVRYVVIQQLLTSERTYQDQLHTVLDVYAEPLRKFSSLTAEEHRILFSGPQALLSLSLSLSTRIDDGVNNWDNSDTRIGNLFSKTFWLHYDQYCEDYSAATQFLEDKLTTDESFSTFCELRSATSQLTLASLLSTPIQRITDYERCLTELLDQTPDYHPDYDDLTKAAERVKEIVKNREADLARVENEQTMDQIQDRFPNDDLDLEDSDNNKHLKVKVAALRRKSAPGAILFRSLGTSKFRNSGSSWSGSKLGDVCQTARLSNKSTRVYVMENPAQITTGLQTSDRHLFLFTDLLLIAKSKSSSNYKLKHRVRVAELWLASCIDDVAEISRPEESSFVIGWPSTNVVVTFSSPELKQTWFTKLQACIDEEKLREQPKEVNIKVNIKDLGETRTITVASSQTTNDVIDLCVQKSQILKNESKHYQLWVSSGKEESAYPLIGHESPFSIQMSHVRDIIRFRGLENVIPEELPQLVSEAPREFMCEFFMKNKKSKKHLIDDTQPAKNKKAKRSPLLNIFKRHTSREDKTLPQLTVMAAGKLFGRPLGEVSSEDGLPAKQIIELLMLLFLHGPFTAGILRKGANEKVKRELRQRLDDGEECLDDDTSPLVVGALLKDYLRSLPESLLDFHLYPDWLASADISNDSERIEAVKHLVARLPTPNNQLLRYLLCVLHHIDCRHDNNSMTSFNLAVCVAQSILWSPDGVDAGHVTQVNDVVHFLIDNCEAVCGEEVTKLMGEAPDRQYRQDSGTDSDSMHSVLSVPDNGASRRDDSSIDSLEHDLYTDASPHLPNSHLSPSNLSRDSGLTLSDSQLYDGTDPDPCGGAAYNRSLSTIDRCRPGAMPFKSNYLSSQSASSLTVARARKKTFAPLASSEEHAPKVTAPPGLTQSLDSHMLRQLRSSNGCHQAVMKRCSAESLQSVSEGTELDTTNERRVSANHGDDNMFFEEAASRNYKFCRQKSVADSTPPLSPHSKISYSSDSLLSDSSLSRGSLDCGLSTPPRSPGAQATKRPAWLPSERDGELISLDLLSSAEHFTPARRRYLTKSMDDLQSFVPPPDTLVTRSHHSSSTDVNPTPSHPVKSCIRSTTQREKPDRLHRVHKHRHSNDVSAKVTTKTLKAANQHRKSVLDSSRSPTIILHTTSADENSVKLTFFSPGEDDLPSRVDIATETDLTENCTDVVAAMPQHSRLNDLTDEVDNYVDPIDCDVNDIKCENNNTEINAAVKSHTPVGQGHGDQHSGATKSKRTVDDSSRDDCANTSQISNSETSSKSKLDKIVLNHKIHQTEHGVQSNSISTHIGDSDHIGDNDRTKSYIVPGTCDDNPRASAEEHRREAPEIKIISVTRKEFVTTVRVPKHLPRKTNGVRTTKNVNTNNNNNSNHNNSNHNSIGNNSNERESKVCSTVIPLNVPLNPPVVVHRPSQPPSYDEALHRTYKIKHGIPLDDVLTDEKCNEQRAASERARRLYEESLKKFHEDTQQSEDTRDAVSNAESDKQESVYAQSMRVFASKEDRLQERRKQFSVPQSECESLPKIVHSPLTKPSLDTRRKPRVPEAQEGIGSSSKLSANVTRGRSRECGQTTAIQRSRSSVAEKGKVHTPVSKNDYPLRDTRLLDQRRIMQQKIQTKNKLSERWRSLESSDGPFHKISLEQQLAHIDSSQGACASNLPWSVSKLRGLYNKSTENSTDTTNVPNQRPLVPPPYVSPPNYKRATENHRVVSKVNVSGVQGGLEDEQEVIV